MHLTNGTGFGVSSTNVSTSQNGSLAGAQPAKKRTFIDQLNQGFQPPQSQVPARNTQMSDDKNGNCKEIL